MHGGHATHIRHGGAARFAGGKLIRAAGSPILLDYVTGTEVSDRFEVAPPGLCPWQTCEQQKESKEGDIDSGNGMNIFPESPSSSPQSWVQDATEAVGVAWPPKK